MPIKIRPDPIIPDHEVLRKIGGGAYGEVWLARGVTGALRAVKVVWREDFEDARGFEREFEGILKFEPISREHPGLVNILHVGRSPYGTSFYYYVMELGDDTQSGRDINAVDYEPRTLRADSKQAAGTRLDTNLCIDIGLRLAEALEYLHDLGLAHRDVKPSNIIFVNGKAQLADIGLVAARGQRTFVGTEGFVPPEGPGSAQADIYSLGKVLYEIATGKDRLDFPELPDEPPPMGERKRWLELNKIICEVCDPQLSRRKITTAAELAESLRRLQRGKRRRRPAVAAWLTAMVLASFVTFGAWEIFKDSSVITWLLDSPVPRPVPPPAIGQVRVWSFPEGADVTTPEGQPLGVTPLTLQAQVGSELEYIIRKPGFRPLTIRGQVAPSAVNEPLGLGDELEVFSPPEIGSAWEDHLGNGYRALGEDHLAEEFVTEGLWTRFIHVTKRKLDAVEFFPIGPSGRAASVVLTTPAEAEAFCDWLRVGALQSGYLTENHEMLPKFEGGFNDPALSERASKDGLKPFKVWVRKIQFGRILLTTTPPGADVYVNGIAAGNTHDPLTVPKVKPGPVEMVLVLEGYKPMTLNREMQANGELIMEVTLQQNQGVVFGKAWQNGLGMKFMPVGQDLMASVWETRVRDFEVFLKEQRDARRPRNPEFKQSPDHPVVFITREDARAFCEWLTKRERAQERISMAHHYRLPTDMEWSRLVGLEEIEGQGPGWRDARKKPVFAWGSQWPPPAKFANLADLTAARKNGVMESRIIRGYDDGFDVTSPVGSFAPNALGLHDLCGNVHEWVDDDYSTTGASQFGVLRGGGWNSFQRENLYLGARNAVPPNRSDTIYGFRVVLAKIPPKPEPEPDPNDHG
jgi:serine/threonine protein kinase/formylglycine-generating enzyme required for sulfatase activity